MAVNSAEPEFIAAVSALADEIYLKVHISTGLPRVQNQTSAGELAKKPVADQTNPADIGT